MLKINNLYCSYSENPVLKNFNFYGECGQIYGITGPNGIGKSTLFKAIMNLVEIQSGEININSANIKKSPKELIYSRVSYVEQDNQLPLEITGLDFLRLVFLCYDLPDDILTVREHYRSVFEDDSILRLPIGNLSGGNQRRILIASALLPTIHLALLDEPFSGLDLNACNSLINFLQNYSYNKLILISSHQMDYLSKVCNHFVQIPA